MELCVFGQYIRIRLLTRPSLNPLLLKFLITSVAGTRDGQTKVVREGDNGVAYSWNMKEQQWDKNKVQELHKPSTEEGATFIKDDAIVHSFGPEQRGRARGLGFVLEHAIESTVAWPTHFISFDFE